MSAEEEGRVQGPVMVVATSVMKKPPLRVAKITDDIVLPRSIPAKTIVVGAAGALIGLVIGALFRSWTSVFYGALIFGTVAILLMNMSPLQGESIWKWLTLVWGGRKGKTSSAEGEKVRLYVGICPVPRAASEATVHIWPGSVRIVPSEYDERGVRIDPRNHNLEAGDPTRWGTPLTPLAPEQAQQDMSFPTLAGSQPADTGGRKSRRRRRGAAEAAPSAATEYQHLRPWDEPSPPGRP